MHNRELKIKKINEKLMRFWHLVRSSVLIYRRTKVILIMLRSVTLRSGPDTRLKKTKEAPMEKENTTNRLLLLAKR